MDVIAKVLSDDPSLGRLGAYEQEKYQQKKTTIFPMGDYDR